MLYPKPMVRFTLLFFLQGIILAPSLHAQNPAPVQKITPPVTKDISDSALLDLVQKQTVRYFWNLPTR